MQMTALSGRLIRIPFLFVRGCKTRSGHKNLTVVPCGYCACAKHIPWKNVGAPTFKVKLEGFSNSRELLSGNKLAAEMQRIVLIPFRE
jgi:hypothetical protein